MSEGADDVADEVVRLLQTILAPDGGLIARQARLEADLQLESIDLLTLGETLRDRYGDGVEFCAHLAELDLDALIDLTVADVAAYVRSAVR